MINPLVIIPGISVLMFTAFELPRKAKKAFFKVPIWLSSSAIALAIGVVGRGVLGPSTGFVSELILFPGLAAAKKAFEMQEKRREKKGGTKMEPDFIIRVELDPGDPRVCDYCNRLLVDEEARCVVDCHSTEYGLVCNRCLGSIEPISSHKQGDMVAEERWYKGG